MKKFLSVSLSILMILCFVFSATPVYATDGSESNATLSEADQAAVTAGTPFRLNDGDNATYHATFKAAYDVAAAGDTIYLLADATITDSQTVDKDITLTGIGNVTLTCNVGNAFWISKINNSKMTVNNLTVNSNGGFITVYDGGNLDLNNVKATVSGKANLKISNTKETSTVNATDTTLSYVNANAGQATVILEGAGTHVLNLLGTTTVIREGAFNNTWGGTQNENASNNAVILIRHDNATGANTVNVGSNAKIIGKHIGGSADGHPSLILYPNGTGVVGSLTVILEAGSELAYDRAYDSYSKNVFIRSYGSTATLKIVDKGCNFTATADSLKAGVVLPTGTVDAETKGGPLAGYKLGETALESNEYVNAEATEAATFKAYFNIYIAPGINPALTSQADVNAVENGLYYRINNNEETYYANFETALGAATNGDTIYLLDNHTTGSVITGITKNVTLTGIGDVTVTHTTNDFWLKEIKSELTVKDITVNSTGGVFRTVDNGILNLDGVTATSTNKAVIKISNGADTSSTINIHDSIIGPANGTDQNIIILEGQGTHTLNLTGNTVLQKEGILSTWCAYNDSVIAVWYNANNSVNTINVGENVKIIGKHGADAAGKANTPSLIVYCNGGLAGESVGAGNLTVNLAEGSTLEFDRANDGENKNVFINLTGDASKVTINDNGCIYKANADSLKAGVVLPSCVTDGNGGKPLGFYMNGANPTFALEYVNAEATEAVEFTPFFFNADGFKLIDGASIRLEKPYGIRFSAQVSAELYNTLKALDENVEFGMILAPTRKVFDGFNPDEMADRDKAIIVCNKWAVENVDGIYGYHGAIYISDDQLLASADEATFEAKISAMAYVKFTVNGETRIIYTEYDPAVNSVSILDVAQGYYNDTVNGSTENAIVNYIIETCKDN